MTGTRRRSDAVRNEQRVLDAARRVLSADPDVPMSQIAAAAGVGMGTVYRHYPSKDALVLALCFDGLARVETLAQNALTHAENEPGRALREFLAAALDAGAGAFVRLAGTFTPPPELLAAAGRRDEAIRRLLQTAQTAGVIRADITAADLELILEHARTVHVADPERVSALQHRYLSLALQGLQTPTPEELPGPPPTTNELATRWTQ
jgi:AcrR family transcriptional regulator